MMDCRVFLVRKEHGTAYIDIDDPPSWGTLIVLQKVADNYTQWYMTEGLYSHHNNSDSYLTDSYVIRVWIYTSQNIAPPEDIYYVDGHESEG